MMDSLINADWTLFNVINNHLGNGLFDIFLVAFRNKLFWIPLYVLMIAGAIWKFGWKGLLWVLFTILSAAFTDVVSSDLIKKNVERVRPCNQADAPVAIISRVDCGSGYSFTSSHATNHMGVAVFVVCTIGFLMGNWKWLWIAWALIIGLSQIYVGVHFPFDVLSGFVLGALLGMVTSSLYNKLPFAISRSSSS